MTTILEAKEVNKSVAIGENEEHSILKDINLQLKKGEFVSVMGPSGSGKSTLLYNISGMDQISAGSVYFNGKKISAFQERDLASLRLTKMGFIFQNIHLLKNLNLLDNIVLSAYLAKNSSRETINTRAMSLMKKWGLTGWLSITSPKPREDSCSGSPSAARLLIIRIFYSEMNRQGR